MRRARILDEDGDPAGLEQRPDGSCVIIEHNCATLNVATTYWLARSIIEGSWGAVPGTAVTRIAHRSNGGHICSYVVVPGDQRSVVADSEWRP